MLVPSHLRPAAATTLVICAALLLGGVVAQSTVEVTIAGFENYLRPYFISTPINLSLTSSTCGDSSLSLSSLLLARTNAGAWKISMPNAKGDSQLVAIAVEREVNVFSSANYQFLEWEGGCLRQAPLTIACRCRIVWDTYYKNPDTYAVEAFSAINTCTLPYGEHAGIVCMGTYNATLQ